MADRTGRRTSTEDVRRLCRMIQIFTQKHGMAWLMTLDIERIALLGHSVLEEIETDQGPNFGAWSSDAVVYARQLHGPDPAQAATALVELERIAHVLPQLDALRKAVEGLASCAPAARAAALQIQTVALQQRDRRPYRGAHPEYGTWFTEASVLVQQIYGSDPATQMLAGNRLTEMLHALPAPR